MVKRLGRRVLFVLIALALLLPLVLPFVVKAETDLVKLYAEALAEVDKWQDICVELRRENDELRARIAELESEKEEALDIAQAANDDARDLILRIEVERAAWDAQIAERDKVIAVQKAALDKMMGKDKWEYLLFGLVSGALVIKTLP